MGEKQADVIADSKVPEEKEKPKDDDGPPPIKYAQLFRYAESVDVLLTVLGYILTLLAGVANPLSALVLGELINAVSNPGTFDETITRQAGYLGLITLGCFVLNFFGVTMACLSAERQSRRLRIAYMRAILRQDQAWYDQARPGEASSRLSTDTLNFQAGLGDKVCLMVGGIGQFVCGFVIAFSVSPDSWRLALTLLAFVPAIGAVFGLLFSIIQKLEGGTDDAYAKAGDVANEALQLIRTVASYGGEKAEYKKYDRHLETAEKAGYKKGLIAGLNIGIFWIVLMLLCVYAALHRVFLREVSLSSFRSYGVGLYAGARFIILNREAHPQCVFNPTLDICFAGGEVIQSLFGLINGAAALGFVFPNAKYIAGAQASAARLYAIIDRDPPIDAFSAEGYIPPAKDFKGRIEFKDVTFVYPTRPDVKVLNKFNLTVEPGQTVALVGASGSGKSTIVGLVLRWYDVNEGAVLVDGVDVRRYNVAWLRAQMGLVNQEPQLLPGTIAENIMLGVPQGVPAEPQTLAAPHSGPVRTLAGSVSGEVSVDMPAVTHAAKASNCHDFISALPDGYDTSITGMQLSGGQKQRVAIARAIVRDPKILLLDEATSALDTQSERIVQASIDALLSNKGGGESFARTSIVIAHRLSTVVNADRVVVLQQGSVIEDGTHSSLLEKEDGKYTQLWSLQRLNVAPGSKQSSTVDLTSLAAKSSVSVSTEEKVDATAVEVHAKKVPADEVVLEVKNPMHKEIQVKPAQEAPAAARVRMDWARLWTYLRLDAGWVAVAVVLSAAIGCLLPGFSLVLASVFDVYFLTDNTQLELRAREYLYIFLGLAGISITINVINSYAVGLVGERFIRRIRGQAFAAVIRQDIGFYDMKENAVGALTTRLGSDASQLRLVVSSRLGEKLSSFATAIMGVVIAFTSSWQLALIVLAISPAYIYVFYLQNRANFANLEIAKQEYAKAGAIAGDATTAIRIVASFGLQPMFLQRFIDRMVAPYNAGVKRAWMSGFGLGANGGFQAGVPALVFYVGAQLMKQPGTDVSFGDVLRVFFAFQFSMIGLQNIGALSEDLAQLATGFSGLLAIIDRPSGVDATKAGAAGGYIPPPESELQGLIEFKDVRFRYPARPEQQVLKGLNLTIQPGQTVAIVGPSGSGKSTLIQLLQRFYDPESGNVTIDGRDLKSYHPAWVRAHIGWVQQEAPLFADSIAYNIEYGRAGEKPDSELGMPREAKEGATIPPSFTLHPEVEQAAADANAAGFIKGFPWHYATFVGIGGLQLSGGQKQRVAIARSIIRAPQILLFDEATSALDSESESVVQASIDKLLQDGRTAGTAKRTTLVIAHRLSTVRGSDLIVVVDKGIIVEQGTHAQLMARREGLYRKLALAQDPSAA